jgi:hypothetical protein
MWPSAGILYHSKMAVSGWKLGRSLTDVRKILIVDQWYDSLVCQRSYNGKPFRFRYKEPVKIVEKTRQAVDKL